MARRGDQLREHILWAAKEVFLEVGFERTAMDAVAARAKTSKRSLYAHFESKERLFLEVVELVRGLVLARLGNPGDHATNPVEALTRFCERYLEILLYQATVQMCRVSMAEAARFPEGAGRYFDVLFTQVHGRVQAYLEAVCKASADAAGVAAHRLLGRVMHPRFTRTLFGVDEPISSLEHQERPPNFDLGPVRVAVTEAFVSLEAPHGDANRPERIAPG